MHVLAELGEAALVVEGDRILDATPAATSILGYTRDELLRVPSALLLADPRERASHHERLAAARAGHVGPAHIEARAITREGQEVTLDVTITAPERPGDGSRVIVLRQVAPAPRVSRDAIRRLVSIIARGPAREATLRTIGREVARTVARADGVEQGIARFNAEGLGDVQLSASAGDRFAFHARDLVERSDDGAPCFLALSFLESLVTFATHRECLGAETTCQARGAPLCTFVVKARSYTAPPDAAPTRAPHSSARPVAASHPRPEPRSPNLLGERRPVSSHGP